MSAKKHPKHNHDDHTDGDHTDDGHNDDDERKLVNRIGPLEIDWPRSIGYFGGAALAVAAGVIDPPVGVFVAAIPFLRMLDLPKLPTPSRFVGQIFEGMAKPLGGDSQGTIHLVTDRGSSGDPAGESGD
jgi:hypothetical protein